MIRKTLHILLIVLLIGMNSIACSQSVSTPPENNDTAEIFNSTDPFVVNRSLGAGVNLGNALEAPNEGDWGMIIREEYLQYIADAGFQSVRIPIRWNAHADKEPPYEINDSFFQRVDKILHWALKNDLKVIINIHHYNELMDAPSEHKNRFIGLWAQIAEHYQEYSNRDLLFEILNEPHGKMDAAIWNNYLKNALSVIRKTNKNRIVMIGTAPWGGFGGLNDLELPGNDQQIIVTVHYYNPFQFTHQGAGWVGDESEQWLGTTWTGTPSQKSEIDDAFNRVRDWSKVNNRPIHLGEFGAYERAPLESRIIWNDYVRKSAEQRDFSWAYWEFGAGFGIYDRDSSEWKDGLLKALIPDTPIVD
ncbi:glycoside hydrolase family 5 protein [Rhodohalobacter sulfatireducens]|uniref:Glycoside hydrolase family 5 protein n=1 Tax=Rhodohalobacter sulfatireducens TaxID=2911366 RepID=A0ABS9KB98_9BACT|nr:glycoside hydrolase family 5 protein [Rhodohalobacter sulfatireducens]MCG2588118.1 glycoside hydrolase family 5 protein [Rhodohalobacter sulfatireducens]